VYETIEVAAAKAAGSMIAKAMMATAWIACDAAKVTPR
jgi:hypothetical protein